MKKLITLLTVFFIALTSFSQAPEKMSYQAVIRDSENDLVTDQQVGMQISILQSSASGTEVYVETQTPTTNGNGLVTLEIGDGTVVSGDFAAIDWSADDYYIKTETDPAGGTSYSIEGTSQLLSVPYALYAEDTDRLWNQNGDKVYYNDGNVGISNDDPDETLVVGESLNSGWAFNAITVGSDLGGAIEVGTQNEQFSASAGSTFERTRLIATNDNGQGEGVVEFKTSNLNIGVDPGVPEFSYATRIVHNFYGLLIEDGSTEDNWEFVMFGSSDLSLYANETEVGSFDATSGNYNALSDERSKTNISEMGAVLPSMMNLKPRTYNYKSDRSKNYVGFLAQELQKEFPEVVTESEGRGENESTFLVDYSQLTVIAISAMQEQQEIIDEQQEKINDLEARIERLESLIDQ